MIHPFSYDVIVIGAGPAGSTAAIRARAAGLSVLVLEKSAFPRFRIGESLLPRGNELLRELGVWKKIEDAGFIEKFGARFLTGAGDAEKNVLFSSGLIDGLDKTYQVERSRFDALLLDHARETGATVQINTTVQAVTDTPDGYRVDISGDGAVSSVVGRWIMDAGGRDRIFPSELKAVFDPAPSTRRVAIYNHFTGVERAEGRAGGDTVVVRLDHGWFWLIPIDATRTSVGLVTTVAEFKADGRSSSDHFNHVVEQTPRLSALMAGSFPLMDFHVTADYSYYRRRLASGRMVLVGDAGGFIDPIFSSGVYLAIYSAKLAVEMIVKAERSRRALSDSECTRYTRHLKAHAGVFRRLIDAFYDEDSFAVFMCPKPPLNLAPGITSIVAGHASLNWRLWWRFKIFLLVCRLQPHLPLVPRIDLKTGSPVSA
ncbi:MAG: tryptophan 7-halogenase [Opitutaceae bacterium]|nr:tryptophan 7-halogenase [Opitutaceae bacterium]